MKKVSLWLALYAICAVSDAASAAQPKPREDQRTEAIVAERLKKNQEDKSLLDIYLAGGWLMHPIAVCSLGTVAIGMYACVLTSRGRLTVPHLMPHLQKTLAHRRIDEAFETCRLHPGLLTDTLGAAIIKANFERDQANRPSMEQAAAETLSHGETRFMYWINYLNFFATVAPMLGLLGTVTGMIQAFDKLSAGLCEPQDLAGGIGEAMITTAGGLIVGIPAMLLYLLYRNNVQSAVTEVQKAVVLLLDILTGDIAVEGVDIPSHRTDVAREIADEASA